MCHGKDDASREPGAPDVVCSRQFRNVTSSGAGVLHPSVSSCTVCMRSGVLRRQARERRREPERRSDGGRRASSRRSIDRLHVGDVRLACVLLLPGRVFATAARSARLATPGLDIARIDSAAENAFVTSKIPEEAWIGADDRSTEGAWRWSAVGSDDGPQFWSGKSNGKPAIGGLYANWDAAQPDDLGTQDCGAMRSSGRWEDDDCGHTKTYVCKGDACPSDPAKLEPGTCGCGISDVDTDGDGRPDCFDLAPAIRSRSSRGTAGARTRPPRPAPRVTMACARRTPSATRPVPVVPCGLRSGHRLHVPEICGRGRARLLLLPPGPVTSRPRKSQCEAKPGMSLVRIDGDAENTFISSHLTASSWLQRNDPLARRVVAVGAGGSRQGRPVLDGPRESCRAFRERPLQQMGNRAARRLGKLGLRKDRPRSRRRMGRRELHRTAGFTCELGPDPCAGLRAGAPWPANRRCSSHEARSTVLGAQTSDLNWATALAGTTPVGSPAVTSDGTIYVAAGSQLFAVNRQGTVQWSFTAGDVIESTPAVTIQGDVYFVSADEHLYGLSPGGTKKVDRELLHAAHSSPAVAADGTVVVSDGDDLQAFGPDGTEKWHEDVGDATGQSPAIGRRACL